ncbi:Rv3212 family protein [Amycolatopsis jiangsuensis]|uniref:Rv3212 family protein n=1 Tax=Amycolatopsis jiangsuensis TaxID=1181879 RepID=UPI001FEC16C5
MGDPGSAGGPSAVGEGSSGTAAGAPEVSAGRTGHAGSPEADDPAGTSGAAALAGPSDTAAGLPSGHRPDAGGGPDLPTGTLPSAGAVSGVRSVRESGGRHAAAEYSDVPSYSRAGTARDHASQPQTATTRGSGRNRSSSGSRAATARRSPWNQRRDWVLVGLIGVLMVALSVIVAVKSDNLHTSRALADTPAALPEAPAAVPGSMTQLWQAPSAATPEPIGQRDTVTTADGGEVAGRDPRTGQIRWHYTRENLPLCTVDTAWGRINAVYHKSMGCSEVTQLDPATGRITAQRNGDAELGTRLVSDGTHVTTTGKHLLDTWRDDLVKSMEYGQVPFPQNANKQPRTGCTYGTVAAAAERIGVIERCPDDPHDRLTVYRATAEHEDEPQVVFSTVLAGSRARVVAMSGELTAVALPEQKLLVTFDADGAEKTAYPLDLPATDLAGDPAGGTEQTTRTASAIYWFTGTKTVALSRDTLAPRWTLDRTLGPGITFANQLVVPIPGGLAVLDEATGATLRTVGVDRGTYSGPVRLTALGPILLEQRGSTVAALR